MQLTCETPACSVDGGRHVPQQELARLINFLKAVDGAVQVGFGQLQLPHEAGRESDHLQHPRILDRKTLTLAGLIGGDHAEPLVACAPWNADCTGHTKHLQHATMRRIVVR